MKEGIKYIMKKRKSRCSITSININLFGKLKARVILQSFLEKSYNVDDIYGLFSDDYTFQFARESSFPFDTWEEVQDKSPFTYYELVHKKQFQLFHMESESFLTAPFVDNIPWHNGELINMDGHNIIPVNAREFIPKNFIRFNRITETDLERFANFVSRIILTNSSLLEDYFPKTVEPQKVI